MGSLSLLTRGRTASRLRRRIRRVANQSTTETITIEVVADTSKANRSIADTEQSVDRMAKTAAKAATAVEQGAAKSATYLESFTRSTLSGAGAVDAYAAKTFNLGQAAKDMQQKLGPAAAAISGVSAALGQNAGEAGKAVAAAGQLVAAFGAGGPLAVAVVGATLVVNQLSESWERQTRAADAALAKTYAVVDESIARFKRAKADLHAARKASATAGETPASTLAREGAESEAAATTIARAKRAEADAAVAAAAKASDVTGRGRYGASAIAADKGDGVELANLQKAADFAEKALATIKETNAERIKANKEAEESAGLNAYLADEVTKAATAAEKYAAAAKDAAKADRGRALDAAVEKGRFDLDARLAMENEEQARADRVRAVEIDAATLQATTIVDVHQEMNDAILASDESLADERNRLFDESEKKQREVAEAIADDVMAMATVATAGIQQAVDGLITGQEHVAEAFAALVMQSAGQALISSGIQLLGAATVSAFTGLLPVAAAQAGAGAGLIAGGVALGGAATAVSHIAAGGTVGQKLPTESKAAKTSTGVNRGGRTGGSGAAGSTNVTIVYGGASGPTADQGAAAVLAALIRARSKGLA